MIISVQERGMQWKDQIRKWIKLHCRSKRTAPSNECHDTELTTITDGCDNGVTMSSPPEDVPATTQPNEQSPVNTLNIFIKHKQSLQESA